MSKKNTFKIAGHTFKATIRGLEEVKSIPVDKEQQAAVFDAISKLLELDKRDKWITADIASIPFRNFPRS